MRSHDHGAEASFCVFFAPVTNCFFTVWVPPCEENCKCPEGCNSLWLRVSNRGEQHPVGTRFCSAKSSVLYLLRPLTLERGCHRTGQTVSSGSRRANVCKHGRLADIRSSGVGGAAKRRSATEAVLHHRGSKRYIKSASRDASSINHRSFIHHFIDHFGQRKPRLDDG